MKKPTIAGLQFVAAVLALGVGGVMEARAGGYDPLVVSAAARPAPLDLTVHDTARDRDIPLRVYLPVTTAAAPVIFLAMAWAGPRTGSAFLGEQWAARGYVAVFLQHPGSDESVWKDEPLAERMRAMRQAASIDNFLLRVQDVPAVLNQLEPWSSSKSESARWAAGFETGGNVGAFLWRGHDASCEWRIVAGGRTKVYRRAHQSRHGVQPERPARRQCR